jgi:hypothetical protein
MITGNYYIFGTSDGYLHLKHYRNMEVIHQESLELTIWNADDYPVFSMYPKRVLI